MGGLLVRSCQGGGRVSFNINAFNFSSNLNNVNLHLKIKARPFYNIMKGFIYPKD